MKLSLLDLEGGNNSGSYFGFQGTLQVTGTSFFVMHPFFCNVPVFRWFKFTLKPPYSIVHDKLRLAIWDTSFWTFWVKFGHKGP